MLSPCQHNPQPPRGQASLALSGIGSDIYLSSTLPKKQARHVGISRSHMAEEAQTSLYQPFGGQRPHRDSLLLPELHSSCFVPKCQRTLHYICRCTDGRTRTPTHPGFFAHHTCNHFRVSLISHAAVCANFRLSSVPSSFRSAILGVPLCQVDFQDRSLT